MELKKLLENMNKINKILYLEICHNKNDIFK